MGEDADLREAATVGWLLLPDVNAQRVELAGRVLRFNPEQPACDRALEVRALLGRAVEPIAGR